MKKKDFTRRSLTVRLPFLLTISIFTVLVIILNIIFFRYRSRMIEDYTSMGMGVTNLMAAEVDPDKTDLYIEKNFELDEYNDIRSRFIQLRENYPNVLYMYVYRFRYDGGLVVFDLDSEEGVQDADAPGDIYDLDPELVKHIDDLVVGNEIPALMGDTEDGYMLTYCKPLFDSDGNYQCHVCVDFSIDSLHKKDIRFVSGIMIFSLLAVIIILLFDINLVQNKIARPLNRMKRATDGFSYETEQDLENNIRIMETLNIRTGDEIEDIYHLFVSFMKNDLIYMERLAQANNTIIEKDTRLGQISKTAYTDTLTEAGTKAAYNLRIAELEQKGLSTDDPFAIMVYDINGLKHINDTYGHKTGDLYIKGCCSILADVYRESEIYRIGGDEFTVILTDASYCKRNELFSQTEQRFKDSRDRVECEPWERYSMSGGIAELTAEDTTIEEVFKRADKDMYDNKAIFKRMYNIKPRT